MKKLDRHSRKLVLKVTRASFSLIKLVVQLFQRKITFRQFLLDVRFRFINEKAKLYDDFDWEIYPRYYQEELKSIAKIHTLRIKNRNYVYSDGAITRVDPTAKPLHPNHSILYSIILRFQPRSILEIGCGAGDHLANLQELGLKADFFGIDRSKSQLNALRNRHPGMQVQTKVVDITTQNSSFSASLVFTQAVLMHISERENRFRKALDSVFESAQDYVVMVENWTQHDFLLEVQRIRIENPKWRNSYIYIVRSESDVFSSAMVISKFELLDFEKVNCYNQFLSDRKLEAH